MKRWRQGLVGIAIPLVTVVGTISLADLAGANPPRLFQQMHTPRNLSSRVPLRSDADRLMIQGGQLEQQGDLRGAIASWEQAIRLYEIAGDAVSIGTAYDYIGLTEARLGRFRESEDALRRRLAVARDNRDAQGEIYALNNIGTVYLRQMNRTNAQEMFEQALVLAKDIHHPEGEGLTLANLALLEATKGFTLHAVNQYQAAAERYEVAGQMETARQMYQQALFLARRLQNPRMENTLRDRLEQLGK